MLALATLIIEQTKTQLYELALTVAESVGVNTTTWQAGDPTRSLFHVESETLSSLESMIVGFIRSGFLDYATGDWLKILAEQVYGVEVPDATYATTTVTLTNAGGGFYDIDENDLTFKNTATGKTYHNTTGGVLASGPGTTLDVTVVADEAGSESSAGAGEIDDMVTTLLAVTCANTDAAVGVDEQSAATTRLQCRDKLGSLSPNGPKDAYSYVARNEELTGTSAITRVRVYPDSDTGDVAVYIAGASGAVGAPDVALVEEAIAEWATPLCITPTVASASSVTVPVTYELWVYKSCNKTTAEVAADVSSALQSMFSERPIGGDIIPPATTGYLYKSFIESTIKSTFPEAFRVSVTAPAGDTALGVGEIAALGTETPTVNLVDDPY